MPIKTYAPVPFKLVSEYSHKDFELIKSILHHYIDCPYVHSSDIAKCAQQIILLGFKITKGT